jgi:general secretion pathway protein C
MKRWPLVASFLLFILLCASIAYWALQLFKPPLRPVAAPQQVAAAEVRPEEAAGLLGGSGGASSSAGNYQLRGVIFSGTPADSVAILSAEGKPAQAIRAGSEVVPGVTVKEVHPAYVLLADNGTTRRVDLPEEADDQERPASVSPVPVRPTQRPGTPAAPPRTQTFPPTAPAASPQTAPAPAGQTQAQQAAPAGQSTSPDQSPAPTQGTQAVPPPTQTAPTAPPTVVVNPPPSPEPNQGDTAQPATGAVPPAR